MLVLLLAAFVIIWMWRQGWSSELTASGLLLVACGGAFGSLRVRLGEKVNLCVSQPFVFAAMVLDGPVEASVVAVVAGTFASYRQNPFPGALKTSFNAGALILSAPDSSLRSVPGPTPPSRCSTLPRVVACRDDSRK